MKFGIIGGSGLYEIEGLADIHFEKISTPFGEPSDSFVGGKIVGKEVVFLPRHGKGHRVLPGEINYRANIWGMKKLGVTHLISVSAVGSLKEEIEPGHIVIPDQFFDRTRHRPSTFFGNGIVAHVQFGNPVCSHLTREIEKASRKSGVTYHFGGTYICMEGPAFSTKAESLHYRSMGASIIGMTNIQEAKLAREAEMCFATIALSTDYDCWHESEEEVTIEAILKVMNSNVVNSKKILMTLFADYQEPAEICPDQSSLQFSVITQHDLIPDQTKEDLSIIIGKYVH